ncbi:MAG: cation-transporting P-type ATPase [Nitrospirae bacterium]|nr:MAG: cation-transporting P-type ATPase [Nitrospirota bacterium]
MKINNIPAEDVFNTLVTSKDGLAADEAARRLREFGPNEISEKKRPNILLKLAKQFSHFLAMLLWIASALSFLSEYLHPGEGMMRLGIAILGVILINGVFTFVQEYRAEKSFEKLRLMLPFKVKVVREKETLEVNAREVVPGDLIVLTEGDRAPADARIVEAKYLIVNNAPLTGESAPVPLSSKACGGEIFDSSNIVFAGTNVLSGSAKAVVFATGMRTEFGRIAQLTESVEAGLSPLQKEIIKATRVIAAIAISIGISFFVVGQFIGRGFWENFIFAVGVIVALVPEGMLPTVTLALAMGSQRMAKKKALIKNLNSVETLGAVSVICTDKTGTLTMNRMEAVNVWSAGDFSNIEFLKRSDPLVLGAALCNNARYEKGEFKGDPTEIGLLKAVQKSFGNISADRLDEMPFDSERRRMTTINKIDQKHFVFAKGAIEALIPLCSRILTKDGIMPFEDTLKNSVIEANNRMMDKGLRVLAFASKEMASDEISGEDFESGLIFSGLIGLEDPLRPEVGAAIEKCRSGGIKVIMLTGDGSRTARAIAVEAGMVRGNPVVVEGGELDGMGDNELRAKLASDDIIFARMAPKHKIRVVSALKDEGERVAVTGDGVNDAPALKKADIGIAMGITGTEVAKEAADMILLDDNFATIVNAVEEGRAVYENIRKFITYIFSSNIPELAPYLAYVLFNIPLPLTIMQILAVDLGTDMLPALALGAEKPTGTLMRRPPRRPNERLLSAKVLSRAYLFLGPIEAVAAMFGYFYIMVGGGWIWGETLAPDSILYMQATTACLTAIIVTQMANVFACRSSEESLFRPGIFSNRLIFAGVAVEFLLQIFIVYHPWGNAVFATAPITAAAWLALVPFAFLLLAADETRKRFCFCRRKTSC